MNLLAVIFVVLFVITGCGIESIFSGGLFMWLCCFGCLILSAWAIGGDND